MNYDLVMQNEIKSLDHVPRLILHSCCAPCSSLCIERLKDYFDITVLYYNPNIEPYEEYLKRKEEQKRFLSLLESKNKLDFLDCDYDNDKFKELVKNNTLDKERGPRCKLCYRQRLEYTRDMGIKRGYEYFTTTLTLSPYKVSAWVNEIGGELEKEVPIKFLYADFKKRDGYKRSIELSAKYGLYRQNYCGCIYSKR